MELFHPAGLLGRSTKRMIWDGAWAHPSLGGRRLQPFMEGRDSVERVGASSLRPCSRGCGHIWGDIDCA